LFALIDEAAGRAEAKRRGVAFSGLLGVLKDASGEGWIDLAEAIERLRATTFRLSPRLAKLLLSQSRP
jgi:predicted nucleic acid-binding protein